MAHDAATLRDRMVRDHLAARGVRDPAVLRAMRDVPREDFVAPEFDECCWFDETRAVTPLRLDSGAEEGDPETFPFAL